MADQLISEAIRRMSFLSQGDIETAFLAAFSSPSPQLKLGTIPLVTVDSPIITRRIYKPTWFCNRPGQTHRIIGSGRKLRCSKSRANLHIQKGSIGSAVKTAVTRQAVKAAFVSGTWQGASLTAVFDIRRLFGGEFQQYLLNVGVSGLYGGTVGGLSSWINHPFFDNGIVLGIIVGSAVGALSLVSTGDWARFGKNLGVNIVCGAAAWGGVAAGAAIGAPFGPVGVAVGSIFGAVAAGSIGRYAAGRWIPGLRGETDREVYETIKRQLAVAGLEPDPSLSPRQLVELIIAKGTDSSDCLPFMVRITDSMAAGVSEFRAVLLDLHQTSPEAFGQFLQLLPITNLTQNQD